MTSESIDKLEVKADSPDFFDKINESANPRKFLLTFISATFSTFILTGGLIYLAFTYN